MTDYSKFEGLEHGITLSSDVYPDSILKVRYMPIPGQPDRFTIHGVAVAPSRRNPDVPLIAYADGDTEIGPGVSPEIRRILTMLHVQTLEANLRAAMENDSK